MDNGPFRVAWNHVNDSAQGFGLEPHGVGWTPGAISVGYLDEGRIGCGAARGNGAFHVATPILAHMFAGEDEPSPQLHRLIVATHLAVVPDSGAGKGAKGKGIRWPMGEGMIAIGQELDPWAKGLEII